MTDSTAEKKKKKEDNGVRRTINIVLIMFSIIVIVAGIYFGLVIMGVKKGQRSGYDVSVSDDVYNKITMTRTKKR